MKRSAATSVALLALALSGCMMIGPDYHTPTVPVADEWLPREGGAPDPYAARTPDARRAPMIAPGAEPIGPWWETFDDPILTNLIVEAYRSNPSLEAAGVRVMQAVANRGIAIGTLFPQTQTAFGSYARNVVSENTFFVPPERSYNQFMAGLDVAWELDIWGKFRRGIESADAELVASLASYEDVLVSLLAEVATNYIALRTAQAQLVVARQNVDIQRNSFDIASRRADAGAVSDVDPNQAASLLYNTEAQIPLFQADVEQLAAVISALLGTTPQEVDALVGVQPREIPEPPATIAIGFPADLLRRRPDVRRSERTLAAQSAQIGVAKADLLPHFQLVGTVALDAVKAKNFFEGRSFEGFGGPQVSWAILNYGRISNNVRVQDAAFQALVNDYTATVLAAQAEVESAAAAHRGAVDRTIKLRESVKAAQKVVDLVGLRYTEGAVDFTTVLVAQQFLLEQQNLLVASEGRQAQTVVTLYKALGGGWEPFQGESLISPETADQMQSRTRWSDLLEQREQEDVVEAAETDTEQDRGWWRWRFWRPQW